MMSSVSQDERKLLRSCLERLRNQALKELRVERKPPPFPQFCSRCCLSTMMPSGYPALVIVETQCNNESSLRLRFGKVETANVSHARKSTNRQIVQLSKEKVATAEVWGYDGLTVSLFGWTWGRRWV